MSSNPYATPKAAVADAATPQQQGNFVPGGRGVAAARGWDWIVDGWKKVSIRNGFEEYDSPILEYLDLFTAAPAGVDVV